MIPLRFQPRTCNIRF